MVESRFRLQKAARIFLGFSALTGILNLILLLSIQSDQQGAWLFGLSGSRLLMSALMLLGILFFSSNFLQFFRNQDYLKTFFHRIEAFLQKDKNSTIILGLFACGLVFSMIYLGFAYTNLDYQVPKDAITSMEQVKAYMYRLAPFFIWTALISGQGMILLTYLRYATKVEYLRVLRVISIAIFPVYAALFWIFNRIDPYYYNRLTKEDNIIEWLTVVFFLLAALLAILHVLKLKSGNRRYIWFLILFGLACGLFAIEEISWGQRIFGMSSSEFFMEHSDQQEINIHNVVNELFSVRTKHVAAWALLAYGVALPLLARIKGLNSRFDRLGIVIPPLVLIPGLLLAAVMTWDRYFDGQDEEVAEFFFSILLWLVMVFQFFIPTPELIAIDPQDP